MKRAIALYARAKVGKSTTLNLLIDLLEVETTSCTMPISQPKDNDRRKFFNYKGNIIGVATGGDNKEIVDANCEFFHNNKCDIVFTATRTRNGSCDSIKAYANMNGINVEWVEKNIDLNEPDSTNLTQAQELLNMI